METTFPCPKCRSILRTQYLSPGELAQCKACGDLVPVPETSIAPDPDSNAPGSSESGSAGGPPGAVPPPLPQFLAGDGAKWTTSHEFRIGPLISQTLRESFLQFHRYAPLAAIAVLPSILGLILGIAGNEGLATFFIDGLGQWLSNVFNALSSAAIISATYRRLQGKPVSLGSAFADGMSHWLSYFFLLILVGLVVFFASLILLLPGIYAILTLAVAGPALVLEDYGVTESMQRSSELVSGYRWKLLGFYTALWFLGVLFFIIFAVLVFSEEATFSLMETFFVILFTVVAQILANVSATVVYKELRAAHGDFDQTELISVFE